MGLGWLVDKSHPERIHDRPASVDAQEDGFAAWGPFCPSPWTHIAHWPLSKTSIKPHTVQNMLLGAQPRIEDSRSRIPGCSLVHKSAQCRCKSERPSEKPPLPSLMEAAEDWSAQNVTMGGRHTRVPTQRLKLTLAHPAPNDGVEQREAKAGTRMEKVERAQPRSHESGLLMIQLFANWSGRGLGGCGI